MKLKIFSHICVPNNWNGGVTQMNKKQVHKINTAAYVFLKVLD